MKRLFTVKKSQALMFTAIVIALVGTFLVIAFAALYIFGGGDSQTHGQGGDREQHGSQGGQYGAADPSGQDGEQGESFGLHTIPRRTTVLLLGLHEDELLPDTIMLLSYNRDTQEADIISVPRDLRVTIPTDRFQNILARGGYARQTCKINEVYNFSHAQFGRHSTIWTEYIKLQIEELLGIQIDYSAVMNLSGFRNTVTAMGGVWINVPFRMYYNDLMGFIIDLQPGLQHLNGAQAEQFVRFRNHHGDSMRIEMQHMFVTEMMRQMLESEAFIRNPGPIVTTVLNSISTDFSLEDMLRYLPYLNTISVEKTTFHTIPGTARYIDNISFFIHDVARTHELIERIFFTATTLGPPDPNENQQVSSEIRIGIENGSNLFESLNVIRNRLRDAGHNVVSAVPHTGTRIRQTRIIVKQEGMGEDLLEFFNNAVIVVDENGVKEFDVLVIIGTDL
jgi:LCP family protein required for cell wall assembly